MRKAALALQRAPLAAHAFDDGQESMKKLAFAPLGLLTLGGNASYVASILASAVAFLEGFSADDLETNVHLAHHADGHLIARTELTLVPYAFPQRSRLAPELSAAQAPAPLQPQLPAVTHSFSMSRTVVADAEDVSTAEELNRFKSSFYADSLEVDSVANEILRTTDSVDVANSVLLFSAQTGLHIPRSTLEELVRRMRGKEGGLAHGALRQLQFEMNCGFVQERTLFAQCPAVAPLPMPSRRKKSKLERLRQSKAPT